MPWQLVNTFGEYRDFEPDSELEIDGLARITFNDDTHTAYAMKANPAATIQNDGPTYLDETIDLTWEDALYRVGLEETHENTV